MEKLREQLKQFIFDRNMTLETASKFFDLSIGTLSKFINDRQNLNQRNEYRVRKLINEE